MLLFLFLQIPWDCSSILTFWPKIMPGVNEQDTSSLTFVGLLYEKKQVDEKISLGFFCPSTLWPYESPWQLCCYFWWKHSRSVSGQPWGQPHERLIPLLTRGPRKIPVTFLHSFTFHFMWRPSPHTSLPLYSLTTSPCLPPLPVPVSKLY